MKLIDYNDPILSQVSTNVVVLSHVKKYHSSKVMKHSKIIIMHAKWIALIHVSSAFRKIFQ